LPSSLSGTKLAHGDQHVAIYQYILETSILSHRMVKVNVVNVSV